MKMYFPSRAEARTYCKGMNLPLTKIKDLSKTQTHYGARWFVEHDTPEVFEVGKSYRLTDETGFITLKNGAISQMNRIQAKEIKDMLKGVVKIKSINDNGSAVINSQGLVLHLYSLGKEERQYFTEVKEDVIAKPFEAKAATPPAITPARVKTFAEVFGEKKDSFPSIVPVGNGGAIAGSSRIVLSTEIVLNRSKIEEIQKVTASIEEKRLEISRNILQRGEREIKIQNLRKEVDLYDDANKVLASEVASLSNTLAKLTSNLGSDNPKLDVK
ncbi:hypothetical protein POP12_130 [Pectobacterium phage POP12]|nr:hypothetical protein POP12_130 [Pectobacterium phage POP12]